jgi:subtilase family serine protease
VASFAQANGLTVTGNHENRLLVPVSGTVAQINQAFNVTMNVYQHPNGESHVLFAGSRAITRFERAGCAHRRSE